MVGLLISAMYKPEKEFVLAFLFKEKKEESSPYRRIFICDKGKDLRNEVVFTAAKSSSGYPGDLEKYVSLRAGG